MGIKTSIICDVCGAEKVESNHWFLTGSSHDEFCIEPVKHAKLGDVIVCGESCAHKLLSQWFDSQRAQGKEESNG